MSGRKLLPVILALFLLTGCKADKAPTQRALDFRTALMEAGGCSFTAAICADYDQRVYDFTVTCDYTTGGSAVITVTEPEEIAGISATVSSENARLEFDGLELDFGQMADGLISPMEAGWLLGQCWTGAYIDCAGADGDLERITYLDGYREKELTVDTWLSDENTPICGEITYEGVRRLKLDITDFTWHE